MSAMPGLKGMIRTIGRREFSEFIKLNAPSVFGKINWDAAGETYVDCAYDVLSDNSVTPHDVREQFFPHLYEIHLLSENHKEGVTYRNKIFADDKAKAEWIDYYGNKVPEIATMATWMQVHANHIFQDALTRVLMRQKESNGGHRYYLSSSYKLDIAPYPFEKFKSRLKSYLNVETGVKMHANMERLDLANMIRFSIYTDPFPKNEQQFKESEKDELDVRLSRKVECFCVSLPKVKEGRQSYFMLKCDFLRTQRDCIAQLFAELVLHAVIHDKHSPKRKLGVFLKRPQKFDFSEIDGFESLRYEGMKVVKQSGGKKPDVFSWRYGDKDFYDQVETDESSNAGLTSMTDVQELYLSIVLQVGPPPAQRAFDGFHDDRATVTYEVTVRSNGDWSAQPTPLDCEVRKIDAVLEAMGLQDVSGDKVLRKSVRK